MPVCSLLDVNDLNIRYQWFTDSGKTRNEGLLRWSEIAEVAVFKRDMYVYDLICLTVKHNNGELIEVDEDDILWLKLVDYLPVRLDGALPFGEWYIDVAFPAYETSLKAIYSKNIKGL